MIEHYEFRVFSQYRDLLGDSIPSTVASSYGILVIRGIVGDSQFASLAEVEQRLRAEGLSGIFAGWKITRSYSADEIGQAQLFHIRMPITHISAEDYGTQYADSVRCTQLTYDLEAPSGSAGQFQTVAKQTPCGVCSRQKSLLRLPVGKFQKKDLFRLVGGELVVSERFRKLVQKGLFVGADIYPIDPAGRAGSRAGEPAAAIRSAALMSMAATQGMLPSQFAFWQWLHRTSPRAVVQKLASEQSEPRVRRGESRRYEGIYQLLPTSKPLEVSLETRFGDDPFDPKSGGHYRCEFGEIAGNMQLSPLKILRSTWEGEDICRTRVHISGRQGYYRPYQILLVSKGLFDCMRRESIKGFEFEVAELV